MDMTPAIRRCRQVRLFHPITNAVWILMNYRLLLVTAGILCAPTRADEGSFERDIRPLLKAYCYDCHNADERESGIQVDNLDGSLPDRRLRLWEGIQKQLTDRAMPPEGEPQPTAEERKLLERWIADALNTARNRKRPNHGSIRRLTVPQYRNTLRELLLLEEDVTEILPPDAVSKEGFRNDKDALILSPRQMEAYISIAEKALDRVLVNPEARPIIQTFRMELGRAINASPCPDKLILGANSHLLANADFIVTEPVPEKPFAFEPFRMQTHYRFNEGYQGNATVRGWREYNSIYHAVFACMRGNEGYPKGLAYQTIPAGLLLRPAIPSAELFGVESTYGPKANFKVSLRELPDHGNFRVTVKAARYDDGLLLDATDMPVPEKANGAVVVADASTEQSIDIATAGIYQVDVYPKKDLPPSSDPDPTRLSDELVGYWPLNDNAHAMPDVEFLQGSLVGNAKLSKSPFGQALELDGNGDALVIPRHESMDVGDGDFSVAAWINPDQLQQSGIVCLGKYSWTHGWYFDMPNNRGVLRIETVSPNNEPNGTVASRPGVIRKNRWQHVAAVVRRGENQTALYVNGYEVARGTVAPTSLDNPKVDLHIGRIQDAQQFKGKIDEVRIYRRALAPEEIQALVEPGQEFADPPPPEPPQQLTLQLGDRSFTGVPRQPAFLAVRLPAGRLSVGTRSAGTAGIDLRISPLAADSPAHQKFSQFEKRTPRLGVHVGLRRDCGSTFAPVGIQQIEAGGLQEYTFTGAINNYPSPDVQKENDNYLAGFREIGVRSEYTDGRDVPRLLIQSITFEGPYYEDWPPKAHRVIFIDSTNKENRELYAREIIRSFATRAFRRPVRQSEEDAFVEVWRESFSATRRFDQSVRDALLVILTSPQFLFLIETSHSPEAERLDEYELASKLSYFLWNGPPDDRLLNLAARSQLHKGLEAELNRILSDPRATQFVSEFASQWLSLDKLDVVELDRRKFASLTRSVRSQLRQEPASFLQHLIQQNRPVRELIRSDYVVTNDVLAGYYGLSTPPDSGFEFVTMKHNTSHLGGVLSQAGIMAGLSDGRESNPVKRGAWFARRIIAEPPADPPPNVPALSEDDSHLTLREKLERHRNQAGCRKCHEGIDPWGLPFEQISAGGLFRTDNVVADATLPDGTHVTGLDGLRNYLIDERIDQVAFSFMKHIAGYAIGRTLNYNEIEFLRTEGVKLRDSDYRVRDMVRFVVTSELFLTK